MNNTENMIIRVLMKMTVVITDNIKIILKNDLNDITQ